MNPVPKPLFLALALAAASAHAIPCPAPIEEPEGEGIEASHHVCGALGVFTQHGKKGFFDPHSGAVVVPAQFDAVFRDYVADTLTPVMKGEHWAYVDTQGKAHTAWEFDQVSLFLYDDALAIVGKGGRYGMINRNGETAVPLEYDRLDGFMRPENGYYLDVKGGTTPSPAKRANAATSTKKAKPSSRSNTTMRADLARTLPPSKKATNGATSIPKARPCSPSNTKQPKPSPTTG